MEKVIRLNDTSNHGGHMVTATGKTVVNGIVRCVDQDMHYCPIPGHGTTPVTAKSTDTKSNSKFVLKNGDTAACGAIMNSGSPNVFCDLG